MLTVTFSELPAVADALLRYAVITCRYRGQWVYCRHRERDTWEIPGGRREPGEAILDTASRELYEETGASVYRLTPVCAYCVTRDTDSYGLLCYADIETLDALPPSEIARVDLFDTAPEALTYPQIQPHLLRKVQDWLTNHLDGGELQ